MAAIRIATVVGHHIRHKPGGLLPSRVGRMLVYITVQQPRDNHDLIGLFTCHVPAGSSKML